MMKKLLSLMIVSLMAMVLVACGGGGNTADNETKNNASEESLEELKAKFETPEKIVSTTVAITEIMEELELDLVGVPTSYKDLPEVYSDATEVGNAMDPDLEIVLSLEPDDVLTVTNLQADLQEKFDNAGVPGTFLDFDSAQAMFDEIEMLGEKYDRVEQAEGLVAQFENKMNELEADTKNREAPKVLILMGIPGSYIVGTEHSYIGDLVKRLGGEIAVEGHDEDFISANTEYLQQTDADIILRAVHGAPEEVVKMFDREFAENDIWQHFKAVEDDRVYDLEETRFGTTANLAVIEAMEELMTMMYPED